MVPFSFIDCSFGCTGTQVGKHCCTLYVCYVFNDAVEHFVVKLDYSSCCRNRRVLFGESMLLIAQDLYEVPLWKIV